MSYIALTKSSVESVLSRDDDLLGGKWKKFANEHCYLKNNVMFPEPVSLITGDTFEVSFGEEDLDLYFRYHIIYRVDTSEELLARLEMRLNEVLGSSLLEARLEKGIKSIMITNKIKYFANGGNAANILEGLLSVFFVKFQGLAEAMDAFFDENHIFTAY